jgi:hypothetical protein
VFVEEYHGACISCGYLCQLSRHQAGQHELTARQRATGHLPSDNTLWCWRRAANLQREVDETEQEIRQSGTFEPADPQDSQRAAGVRRVVQKGRDCERWYQWTEHLTPKEHHEEERTLRLVELEQRSMEAMKAIMESHTAIMKTQAEIAEATRQVAADHKLSFERSEHQATWFQRAFIVLAVIALVLALLPLCYPNGIGWLADHAPGAERNVTPTPLPQLTPDTEDSQPQGA